MAIYALGGQVPRVHPEAYVHPDATLIGAVTIEAEATVWPQAVLRGDYGEIRVGARTSIQDGTVIHATAATPTLVGAHCVVGHCVHMEGCTIEDGSLVGSNSVVLHYAVVETGALVGAGAVIPNGMRVPSGAMALGVPAKIREGSLSEERVAMIAAAVELYVANGRRYRTELRRLD